MDIPFQPKTAKNLNKPKNFFNNWMNDIPDQTKTTTNLNKPYNILNYKIE